MGVNISHSRFQPSEFREFQERLRAETALLARCFQEKRFSNQGKSAGLELEIWLTDENWLPAPVNDALLNKIRHAQVVPEISKFNIEINSSPRAISPSCLRDMHEDLSTLWKVVQGHASAMGLRALTIGSLPTLRDNMLGLDFLSDKERYRALNEQVMLGRKNRPIHLNIEGREQLEVTHQDIMLEAAATSLQVHFQVEADRIARYYNASFLASIPLVALAANSPYLFGRDLWDETRIPVFEQSTRLPGFTDVDGALVGRVSFGSGYVRESLLECFLENLDAYPVLLPVLFEEEREWLAHLRLHNGNIWRWNRPILGLSRTGQPHLRIEQRVPSAGPTIVDCIANAAFFLGLTHRLANHSTPVESSLPFAAARNAFYESAKKGMAGEIPWIDGKRYGIQELLQSQLLNEAREGLLDLGVAEESVRYYLKDILSHRVRTGRNGASWQRAYLSTHGPDFQGLVAQYFAHQESGAPVHEWPV